MKGFGIRIGKERKTFMVLIASGRRQTIGHYPLMSLVDAREEARRILGEKELGKVRPTRMAFDDAKRDFLEHCAKKNRHSERCMTFGARTPQLWQSTIAYSSISLDAPVIGSLTL